MTRSYYPLDPLDVHQVSMDARSVGADLVRSGVLGLQMELSVAGDAPEVTKLLPPEARGARQPFTALLKYMEHRLDLTLAMLKAGHASPPVPPSSVYDSPLTDTQEVWCVCCVPRKLLLTTRPPTLSAAPPIPNKRLFLTRLHKSGVMQVS